MVDYDKTEMPASYDAGRTHAPGVMEHWLSTIESQVPKSEVSRIIDLGCGTGRFTGSLAAHYQAAAVGIDPSADMLAQARAKDWPDNISFMQGSAEAVPLVDGHADLVFLSMVFHHLSEPEVAARECRRLCRAGGYVCLRQPSRERLREYPYLDYFPSIQAIGEERLPTQARVNDVFTKAGFVTTALLAVDHQLAPSWADYAEKLSHRADSFLSSVPDDEFETSLDRMRADIPRKPMGPVPTRIDLFVFQATA